MARSVRPLTTLVIASMLPLLTASSCKKDPPAVVDAGPAPTPTPADTTPTDFQPLSDDAGADTGVDAGQKPHWTGPAQNGNVARLKVCCAQLSSQAKTLGTNSPEGGMLMQAAAQCNTIATQAGPNGNAPELGAIRLLLQGKNVPNACGNF